MNTGQPALQRIDLFHKPLELRPVGEVSDVPGVGRSFRANPNLWNAVVIGHLNLTPAIGAGISSLHRFVVKEQNAHA